MKFLLLIMLMSSSIAQATVYNYTHDVRVLRHSMSDLNQMDIAQKTDKVIANMVDVAASQLKRAKHRAEATAITEEYKDTFDGYLTHLIDLRLKGLGDIGDHAPLSEWLAKWYDELYKILGPEVMALTHLEDIKVINFTIPVVFHLTTIKPNEIDAKEYAKHWDPFWGVVTYWGVWGSCEVVTYGGGWFVVCSPIAMGAKYVVVNYIAPKFSDNGYNFFYKSNIRLPNHPMDDKIGCIGVNVLDLCKL